MKLSEFIISGGYLSALGNYMHNDCQDGVVYRIVIEKDCQISPGMSIKQQNDIAWEVFKAWLLTEMDDDDSI